MISVKTNINVINTSLIQKLKALQNPRPLLRQVATNVLPLMVERIHEKGEDVNGQSLGGYSNRYLKFRQENGRGGSDKKKESFTRQLGKSLDTVANERGWCIGILTNGRLPMNNFLNKKNKAKGKPYTKKSSVTNSEIIKFQEEQTGKRIWGLSKTEKEYAINNLKDLVSKVIK